ncbi:MAG: hypothetical protein ACK5B9_11980, partial [Flavobacteriia bacterium]
YEFNNEEKEKIHWFNVYIKSEKFNYQEYSVPVEIYISSKNGLPLMVATKEDGSLGNIVIESKDIQNNRKVFVANKRRLTKILM